MSGGSYGSALQMLISLHSLCVVLQELKTLTLPSRLTPVFFIGSAYRSNASTRTIRHNGTQTYTDTGDTGTITYSGSERSSIGGRYHGDAFSDPAGFLNGSIKEIIVLDNATDQEVQLIEGYLAWKWGLESNLPVDHPYASEPPASAEHMVTADVSMSAADSYNASTPISPALGVNDYYLTDITNRTPVILRCAPGRPHHQKRLRHKAMPSWQKR